MRLKSPAKNRYTAGGMGTEEGVLLYVGSLTFRFVMVGKFQVEEPP